MIAVETARKSAAASSRTKTAARINLGELRVISGPVRSAAYLVLTVYQPPDAPLSARALPVGRASLGTGFVWTL